MKLKKFTAGMIAGFMAVAGAVEAAESPKSTDINKTDGAQMKLTQEWDKTFPKSDKVEHKKVT